MKQNYAFASAAGRLPGAATLRAVWRRAAELARGTALSGAVLLAISQAPDAQAQQRQAPVLFQEDGAARTAAAVSPLAGALRQYRPLSLDVAAMQSALAAAPLAGRAGAQPVLLTLPLPNGTSGRFRVVEYPLLSPQAADIKTYSGVGVDDPSATVQLDLTPRGFHAQILSDQNGTVYIDPVTHTDTQHYLSFARSSMPAAQLNCGVTEHVSTAARRSLGSGTGNTAQRTSGTTLRTYRLAVAATGEYTTFHGGTVALAQAAITTTINRVRGVYEKDLAVSFTLVNNTSIIYTNAGSDPYTNTSSDLAANQTTITNAVGSANYDVGHLMGTGGGGVAGLGVVCISTQKARGLTGSPSPVGDSFDIDYVAHELGHQFGADHTFNADGNGSGSCNGNRNASTAYEPGSGTTIMAYAGICTSANNTQNNSNAYFHVASYEEIMDYLSTTSCGTSTASGNTPPSVTVPASGKVLPIGTPFKLTAVGSDANGDALAYCWEEYDLGSAGSPTATQVANDDVPLFRSFSPTSSPTRYFPQLTYTISGAAPPLGERLPTVTRDLNFRVTVRDHYTTNNTGTGVTGGVNSSPVVALSSTSAAGPFLVTAPNTAVTWTGGNTQTVTWSVAGTTANGVNCATVNILLSTDGGLTYPTVLLAGTANDGSATVTAPSINTSQARIMVEAADNYFFDISNANFTINSAAVCAAPTNLSVGSITATSASVSFTASGSATGYTVTTTPATTTQTVSGSPVSLTGLVGGTSYTVNIVSNCAGGTTSTAATTSFTTSAPPVCNAVTNVAVGSITGTSASVSFTASAGATNYVVTTSPATTTQTVTASPVSLTGLTAGTSYTVNIQTNCSNGGTATATADFGTLPGNDECAGAINLISATSCNPTAGTVTGATQSQAPSTCNGAASATAQDVWYSFVASGTSHTVQMTSTFDGVVQAFSGSCGSLTSLGCRDLGFAGDTETLALNGLTVNTRYFIRVYPFTSNTAAVTGTFTVCVTGTVTPTCAAPTNLSAGSVTSTSASVSFTANALGTSYTVTTSPATTTQTVTASPVSLSGLTPGTNYTVSIQTTCTNGVTSTAATTSFTTSSACAAPTSLSVGSITSSSASVSFTASGSATNYTVTTSPATTTQTVTGSPVSLSGLAASTAYTVSIVSNCTGGATSTAATANFTTTAAPVVSTVLTNTNLTYPLGATISVTVRFSQNVVVTGLPSLALTIGSTTRQATYSAANSSGTDVRFDYVVQAGDLDTNGITVGAISLNGGTIRNAASTNANLTLNGTPNTSTVLVDGVVPTVSSITRQTPATALTNGSSVTFAVTFSENVTGVDIADFALTTTGTAAGTVFSVSGSNSTRTVVVNSLSGDGTLRLDLVAPGSSIIDAATNPIAASFTSGQTFTLDHTAPTTTIDSNPPVTTTSTSATFTFSGNDGSGSGVASFAGSLDGAAFTTVVSPLTFTGLATGQHTFQVRATDQAGNVDATPASYTWTVVAITPAPTISGFTPTSGPVGTVVTITGTNFTGATAVSFNGTAAASFTVNSATQISATVAAGTSTGTISVTTGGGTASSSSNFTVTTRPVVTTLSPTRNLRNAASSSNVTVTFDQAMAPASTAALRLFSQQRGGLLNVNGGGTSSVSGSAISFDPTNNFKPGETVMATITTAAQSSTGNNLAAGQVYQFTAAAGAGPGTFFAGSNVPVGSAPEEVATGDLDGDGDLDFVVTNFNDNTVSVALNNSSGVFTVSATLTVGNDPQGVALGDVNGDGRLDILTANVTASTVSVLLNTGSAAFAAPTTVSVGTNPYDIALGDVDADGDLDFVTVSNNASGTASVRLNNGSGGFSAGATVAVATSPRRVALADVNNDGTLDILAASNSIPGAVSVRLGDGAGAFSGSTEVAVGDNPWGLAVGDVNNDGNLDLLTASSSLNSVSVRLGSGTGTFGGSTTVAVGSGPSNVILGDVNGDGNLDLLTANSTTSTVSIAQGNGAGAFAAATTASVGNFPQGLAVADVDGDLDLDMLAVSGLAAVNIRFNRLAAPTITSLNPTSGLPGANVTITGTGFTGATAVAFNGTASAYTVVNATTITTTVPAGATTGNVTVTGPTGTSNGVNFTVQTVTPAPTISSFTPTSGPAGTVVTITGTNFTGATAVSFNGTAAASFTVVSATSITATVPSGASTGLIAVTTGGGTASSSSNFTVTLPDLVVSTLQNIPGGSYNNVTVTGTGTLVLGGGLSVAGAMMVMDGGSFQSNCNTVSGPGSFTLAAGGTMSICSPAGITSSGSAGDIQVIGGRSFSNDASYVYNGSQAQVTGSGLPATVRSLTLNNAAGLTLSGNVSIRRTLTPALGTLTTTGRVLTLLSDASTTAIVVHTRPVAGTISGPITVQRYVDGSLNAGAGYRHFSSPVTNTTVADLATAGFTPVVNPLYNSSATPTTVTPFPNVFGYDETRLATTTNNLDAFSKGWVSPSSTSQAMNWGEGYTVNCPAGITVDFVGTPGQTQFNRSNLTRGTDPNAGWQLLGNPYPAPLDWDSVRLHGGLGNMEQSLYVFKSSGPYTGTYASYINGIGANGGGPILPVAQGFFVRPSTAGVPGTVILRNVDRLTTPVAPAFQRQAQTAARPLLRLRLSSPANAALSSDEAVVYLQDGATAAGTDALYDAPKLRNPGNALGLASLMNGVNSQPLAINALPLLPATGPATRVPLLLELPAAGAYRFQVADLVGFDAGLSVTLLDHATGSSTDLRQATAYAFTAAQAGTSGGRFELLLGRTGSVTATTAGSATQFSVWPNPATKHGVLHIALSAPANTATLTLHTLLGQVVSTRSFSGSATDLPTTELAAGTYLLTVQAASQASTTLRVVVE